MPVPLIDTHVHLDLIAYDDDRDAVVARAHEAGVTRMIIPAIDIHQTGLGQCLADTLPGIYCAAGVHPNSTANFGAEMLDIVQAQAAHPRCVSIGEIGLDYHWDRSPRDRQHTAFEAQLTLAARLNLPVIIHNREATEDTLSMLAAWSADLPPALHGRAGVLHSFSGTIAQAEQVLAMGFYLGFSGPITYKNADETRRVASIAPLDRLLIETDGPFLTPIPHRGQRNEPAYVTLVAARLAALRSLPVDEIAAITTANAERLFALPPL